MSTVQATASMDRPNGWAAPRDPLGSVIGFGDENVKVGWTVGLAAAALLYGYVMFRLLTALLDMQDWIEETRGGMDRYFWSTYEVDTADDKPKAKEEAKQEEKQEEVEEQAAEPVDQKVVPQQTARVQPTQAAAKTNAYDDVETKSVGGGGGEINDRTGEGTYEHASGEGDGVGGGKGKGFGQGSGGGKGDKPVAAPPPGPPTPPPVDKSAPATLVGSKSWNCPFPPEADAAGKDSATVQLVVTVGSSGNAQSVKLIADPGNGFGRAARSCALARKYKAGLDRDGNPTTATTPPITVRFSR